jgi:hypothetical protein
MVLKICFKKQCSFTVLELLLQSGGVAPFATVDTLKHYLSGARDSVAQTYWCS